MAGLGQADQQLINVPQGPLVSPATPVGQDAVNSMINAFRSGAITSQDIIDRVGVVAQAKNKDLLQTLGEHVSPQAIQSRMAGVGAAGATADLATQQAQAEQSLLPAMTALAATQTAAQQATADTSPTALQSFDIYAAAHGDGPDNYMTQAGKPDFAARAAQGIKYRSQAMLYEPLIARLLPDPKMSYDEKLSNNTNFHHDVNQWGEDITRPTATTPASPTYLDLIGRLKAPDMLPKLHPYRSQLNLPITKESKTGVFPTGQSDVAAEPPGVPVSAANPIGAVPGRPIVNPVYSPPAADQSQGGLPEGLSWNPEIAKARDVLVAAGATLRMVPVNPATTVPTPTAAPIIQPAAIAPISTTASVIEPDLFAPSNTGQNQPTFGNIRQAQLGNVRSSEEIRKDLSANVPYATYQKMLENIGPFEVAAKRVAMMPPAQQRSADLNFEDMSLAESLIKMYDPQGVIREFKWDKMADRQELMGRVKNIVSTVLSRGTFTPPSRENLVRTGYDIIKAREQTAKTALDLAANQIRANRSNVDPNTTLTQDDIRLIKGQFSKSPYPERAAVAGGPLPPGVPATAYPANITGLGAGHYDPVANVFHPATAQ